MQWPIRWIERLGERSAGAFSRDLYKGLLLVGAFGVFGCAENFDGSLSAEDQAALDAIESYDLSPFALAADIQISKVTVNQGVEIPIVEDSLPVAVEDRVAPIIRGRDTLIRAYWEIPEDWTPREIEAFLIVEDSKGEVKSYSSVIEVKTPSHPGDIRRTFWWGVLGKEIQPDSEFVVALYETNDREQESGHKGPLPIAPSTGLTTLDVDTETMEMSVTIVPVDYRTPDGRCETYPELGELERSQFYNALYEQNPLTNLELTFAEEPIVIEEKLETLGTLFQPLRDRRRADGAGPDEYYYALVDACSGGVNEAAGLAPGIARATPSDDYLRVSAGVWHQPERNYPFQTFVHELGHNQGLRHVGGCGAAGADPDYPDPKGKIQNWGFGIRSLKLHSATGTNDYMSYCQPSWTGLWTWNRVIAQVRTMAYWESAMENRSPVDEAGRGAQNFRRYTDQGEVEVRDLLVGLQRPSGDIEWSIVQGGVPDLVGGEGHQHDVENLDLEVVLPNSALLHGTTQLLDDGTRQIIVPLPESTFPVEDIGLLELSFASESQAKFGQHGIRLQWLQTNERTGWELISAVTNPKSLSTR